MPRCKTCKHWGEEAHNSAAEMVVEGFTGGEEAPEGGREAALDALARPKHRCNAIPFYCDPKAMASTADVRDGSGYCGVLTTREDFGCVLHEVAT